MSLDIRTCTNHIPSSFPQVCHNCGTVVCVLEWMAGTWAGSKDLPLQNLSLHILVNLVDGRETHTNHAMVSALLAAAFPINRYKGIKGKEHLFCFYSVRQFRKSLSGHWLTAKIMERKHQWLLPTTKNTHLAVLVWKRHKWMAVALINKVSNSWGAEQSDFQSYHIILRMSNSQQKITKYTKKHESMAHLQEKNFDRSHAWGSPDIRILAKDIKSSYMFIEIKATGKKN